MMERRRKFAKTPKVCVGIVRDGLTMKRRMERLATITVVIAERWSKRSAFFRKKIIFKAPCLSDESQMFKRVRLGWETIFSLVQHENSFVFVVWFLFNFVSSFYVFFYSAMANN